MTTDMDNNESWATLSQLWKGKNGISKHTWKYNHQIDIDRRYLLGILARKSSQW